MYEVGIVTSRVRESVFEMPELAKLKNQFKVVVAHQDTMNHKPHPEPLLLAAQKLGIAPEECVYIGDTINDIVAAKAAGMKVIHYSKAISNDADAGTFVFSELLEIVGSLGSTRSILLSA